MNFKTLDRGTLNSAVDAVYTVFQVSEDMLLAQKKVGLRKHVTGAVMTILYNQRYSPEQIASELGVTRATVWNSVNKWDQYLQTDSRSLRLYLQSQSLFLKLHAKEMQQRINDRLAEIRHKKSPAV